MLLWFDSLDYIQLSSMLGQLYPQATGIFTGQTGHPSAGRTCIASQGGTLRPPIPSPSGFGSDICTLGFRFNLESNTTPLDSQPFLEFRDSGGNLKVRILLRHPAGSRFWFDAYSSDGRLLMTTSSLPRGAWAYLEFQVHFSSSQGKIVFRVDGTEDRRSENLNTDPNAIQQWRDIVFLFNSPPAVFRLADLYVLDGTGADKTFKTFLGPILPQPHHPLSVSTLWGPDPSAEKTSILWIAGQSNAQGQAEASKPHFGWRNPNNFVEIWWPRAGAWQPIDVGVNTWGHLYDPSAILPARYGMEVQFAERVAELFSISGATTSSIKILKTAVDASSVIPGNTILSWHPSQPASAFYLATAQLAACVAALGGWSQVKRVDLVWYQGETETLADVNVLNFIVNTVQVLNGLLGAVNPTVPTSVLICRINHLFPRIFPTGVERVRSSQEQIAQVLYGSPHIDTDDLQLLDDYVHLGALGCDCLGDRVFDRWIPRQGFQTRLTDQQVMQNPPDLLSLGSASPGTMVVDVDGKSLHSPSLGVCPKAHIQSTPGGTLTIEGKSFALVSAPANSRLSGAQQRIAIVDRNLRVQNS